MVLAGLLTLAMVYDRCADRVVDTACSDSVLYLAGRSVLAGYDRDLKTEYGILAFGGTESLSLHRAGKYISYSLAFDKTASLRSLDIRQDAYSLQNTDVFRKEISEYTKYALLQDLLTGSLPGTATGEPIDTDSTKTLRNERILLQLPSYGMQESGGLWETVSQSCEGLDDVFTNGTEGVLTDLYLMAEFKNAQDDLPRKTFFRYEGEYILHGKTGDAANRKAFRRDLVLLRNVLNGAYLLSDPAKQEELLAAAELLAPGPGGLVVQAVLTEAWALLEAENDVQLLEHGRRVPMIKTAESWATDLSSVTEGTGEGYIDKENLTGFVYRDYLRIFLFFLDDTVKLTRMMDLIQINMQGNYDAGFLIRDRSVGMEMEANVNGRDFYYVHTYE